MHESPVSKVYAKALMELAAEVDAVDAIEGDLNDFVKLLDDNQGLKDALTSPVFTVEERQAVLRQLLPKCNFHPLTGNLLQLTNEKGRLPIIGIISASFSALADKRAGRVRVDVTTAEPMSPQVEAEVRAALAKTTGKKVILNPSVDPTLLGGIVAKVGGTVYDSSVRSRLERLKRDLLHAQPTAITTEA